MHPGASADAVLIPTQQQVSGLPLERPDLRALEPGEELGERRATDRRAATNRRMPTEPPLIDRFLRQIVELEGSDLHVREHEPPFARYGKLQPCPGARIAITPEDLAGMMALTERRPKLREEFGGPAKPTSRTSCRAWRAFA